MIFELELVGGPLARRLERRRDTNFDWSLLAGKKDESARIVWTQSAFSEIASAAAFANIASGLLSIGAPIDLVAAAGDFVVDEIFHAELSARVAMALGGAVPLEVDWEKLVRPPKSDVALLAIAERIVRTSCVGETLTVAILLSAKQASSSVIADVIGRIARDEAEHAELGWTFLDWAAERFSPEDRAHLGAIAREAIESFDCLFTKACTNDPSLGVMSCDRFDPVFARTLDKRVLEPLASRGIDAQPASGVIR